MIKQLRAKSSIVNIDTGFISFIEYILCYISFKLTLTNVKAILVNMMALVLMTSTCTLVHVRQVTRAPIAKV